MSVILSGLGNTLKRIRVTVTNVQNSMMHRLLLSVAHRHFSNFLLQKRNAFCDVLLLLIFADCNEQPGCV